MGATLAVFGAIVFVRKVTAFPGVSALGYLLPGFGASYGVVIAFFLALRLDYSNALIFTSWVIAVLTAFAVSYRLERGEQRRFYLVPTGRTNTILDVPGVEWIILETADVPTDPRATIVADLRHDHEEDWERMLAVAALNGHAVYHTKQLRESLTGRVTIEHLSENSFGSLLPNLAYRKAKRLIDVAACLIALPFVAVPMVVIAIVVCIDSRGPALFSQERVGYRGERFRVYKFRSMRLAAAGAVVDARTAAITQHEDDRVTRFGRFIRRSRLDELPQLFNVLRGDMSLIGPRPEAVSLAQWYESELPFYVYRHIVRPGITGWAQVNQGHVADLDSVHTKLHYDFYYIKNFSAWLDILIAMRTLAIMLTGFGSR